MIASRRLPRTLRGAGGIRLINMPGVIYPESVLKGVKGSDTTSGKPYTSAPSWGVSSRSAAAQLGVSVRTARALLNQSRAKYQLVEQSGRPACLYWDRRKVNQLVSKRLPLVTKIPEKFCSAREACYILQVARSTLSRYVKLGLIKEYPLRHLTPTGVRQVSYYLRADVRGLSNRRRASRIRTEEMRRERLQRRWEEQRLLPE